jgi:hypothetical protein
MGRNFLAINKAKGIFSFVLLIIENIEPPLKKAALRESSHRVEISDDYACTAP